MVVPSGGGEKGEGEEVAEEAAVEVDEDDEPPTAVSAVVCPWQNIPFPAMATTGAVKVATVKEAEAVQPPAPVPVTA